MKYYAIELGIAVPVVSAIAYSSLIDSPQYRFLFGYEFLFYVASFILPLVVVYLLQRFYLNKDSEYIRNFLKTMATTMILVAGAIYFAIYVIFSNLSFF